MHSNSEQQHQEMEIDDGEQDKFRIWDNPSTILDQYLGGDKLEGLILEEGNVFDTDLP